MKPSKFLAALALALLVQTAATTVRAGYLVNPAGGTVVFSDGGNADDAVALQTLPFTFSLFGSNVNSLYISTNGNLNTSGSTAFSNGSLATSFAQIAPLWDDQKIYTGSGLSISQISNANYFATTWDVASNAAGGGLHRQFQAVLVGATTQLGGVQFQPGDIVFSYLTVGVPFDSGDATVGVGNGSGTFATLPSLVATGGVLTSAQAGLLPTTNSVLLFRPNGTGSYNESAVSAVTVVPEPSTWALLGVGAGLLGLTLQRRQRD